MSILCQNAFLRNLYFIYFCIDGADVDVDDVFASGDVVVDVVDNVFVKVKFNLI